MWDDAAASRPPPSRSRSGSERIIERGVRARPSTRATALDHVVAIRRVAPACARERGASCGRHTAPAVKTAARRYGCRRLRRRGALVASMTMLAAIRETLLDGDGARRARRSCSARTSPRTVVCSASPTAPLDAFGDAARVRHADLRVGHRRRQRSGCRSRGWCRWPRSSSAASPCRRTTSSSGSWHAFRYRSRSRFHCPVTVRSAYGGGVRTPEHHSDSVEAPYTHTPGLERRRAVERGRRQGPAHHRGAQ